MLPSRRPDAPGSAALVSRHALRRHRYTILVSGFGWRGTPGEIVDAALEGRFISITSDALLAELSRVLRYEQLRAKFPEPDRIVTLWEETCVVVSPAMSFELAAGDDHVLEAAAEGSVDYIVTGDKPLLALADDNGVVRLGEARVSVTTARAFLEVLTRSS
jgi:putative PIN family toxin of toxin-antitoxin system